MSLSGGSRIRDGWGLLPWLAGREQLTSVNAALAWTGLGLGAGVPILLALPVGSLVKVLAVLAFACFGTGPALLCRIRLGSATVSWAIALVLSMSLFALPAAVMIWTAYWHPMLSFYSLDGLAVFGAAAGLSPTFFARTVFGRRATAQLATRREPTLGPVRAVDAATTVMRAIVDDDDQPDLGSAGGSSSGGDPMDRTMIMAKVRPGFEEGATGVIRMPDQPARDAGETAVIRISDEPHRDASETAVIRLPEGLQARDTTMVIPAQRSGSVEEVTSVAAPAREIGETAIIYMPDDWQIRDLALPEESEQAEASVAGTGRLSRLDWVLIGQVSLLLAATAGWVVSLLLSKTAGVGDYGLLSVMHPTFFVGLALCVTGFVVEIGRGGRRGWLLLANLLLLLLIMHATVPILVQEPEYAWTYKHIGVIRLFQTSGRVINPNDIYQAWPTFFASVAQLGTVSGASILRIAAWGPLFFDLANCLPLYAIIRTLTNDRRVPYLTVFVFTCVNWVAQDYMSPQAFAYVLALGSILVMVRWLRRTSGPATIRFKLVARVWKLLQEGMTPVPYVAKRTEWVALGCLYLFYEVVVISHQLSPYLIALSAAALVILGLIRTWQVIPLLLGLAVLYLLPHYGVADQYGLFDGINIFKNLLNSSQGVSVVTGVSSHGQIFSAEVVQLLTLTLWALAAISVIASRSQLGKVALPAVLAFAPFATLLGQGYGGEAIYRVYLFSAPWSVYLVCRLVIQLRHSPKALRVMGASLLVTVAALVGIQGEHGQLVFDQFTPDEVQASQYVYTHAPKGSVIVAAEGNMPARLTENYVDYDFGADPVVFGDVLPYNPGAAVSATDMVHINNFCSGFNSPVYVVIMQSMINYAHYFGYLPDGELANLRTAMTGSPYWDVVYQGPDSIIFRFDV